jgi:hypothetical protein
MPFEILWGFHTVDFCTHRKGLKTSKRNERRLAVSSTSFLDLFIRTIPIRNGTVPFGSIILVIFKVKNNNNNKFYIV